MEKIKLQRDEMGFVADKTASLIGYATMKAGHAIYREDDSDESFWVGVIQGALHLLVDIGILSEDGGKAMLDVAHKKALRIAEDLGDDDDDEDTEEEVTFNVEA